jgi:hypothetical protein
MIGKRTRYDAHSKFETALEAAHMWIACTPVPDRVRSSWWLTAGGRVQRLVGPVLGWADTLR